MEDDRIDFHVMKSVHSQMLLRNQNGSLWNERKFEELDKAKHSFSETPRIKFISTPAQTLNTPFRSLNPSWASVARECISEDAVS